MKVDSKIFRGIEYVEVNDLPTAQRDALLQTINNHLFIKILIDGKIVSQCLQYKDYCHWFENVYSEKAPMANGARVAQPAMDIKSDLALNKA